MRGKPELRKLLNKSGELKSPYWYISYYDGKRSQRISTGCVIGSQDHEATLVLAAFILERERPTAREPDKLMVAQALTDYYQEHAQYIATKKGAQYHEARLLKHFGNRFISHITPSLVNKYVRERQVAGESNGTIRRDLEHLKAALNHEVREGRLIYAPKFKLPSPPEARDRHLKPAEIDALLAACIEPHTRNFIILMLNTGQRPAAIENLQWFQVDLKERIIRFDKAAKMHSNKRSRAVPMNDEVYTILSGLNQVKQTEFVLEYTPKGENKKARHAGCLKKSFKAACKRAGIENASRYTLRHTFGTNLYIGGMHEKTISDLMGHTTAKTTSRHYLKMQMDSLRDAVNSIGKNKTAQKVRKKKR